ncbi:MAG: acyltransferase family protein [Ruminococcus sp.]|nr:acyltransferase family protein [Ruminococcus sp.]
MGDIKASIPKRYASIDLLRCLAFLFVVIFHSFLNIGHSFVTQDGFSVWIADVFRFLSISCIGLYLMISGYLRCNNTSIVSCYRGLVSVLVGYLLTCMVVIPVRHFLLDQVKTFTEWIESIFKFTAISYGWYVEMFIGLSLLIPFINMALKYIGENKKHMYVLAAALLFMTALPGITTKEIAPDYWRIAYPITYYVLGAIVRKLQPEISTWLGLLEAFMMAGLMALYTISSGVRTYKEQKPQFEFQDLWIVFIVFFLFISLYRVSIPDKLAKVLAFMSSGCFCGYLISSVFDAYFYKLVPQWKNPDDYFLIFICVTIPIYIASMLCGVILQKITDLIVRRKRTPK